MTWKDEAPAPTPDFGLPSSATPVQPLGVPEPVQAVWSVTRVPP